MNASILSIGDELVLGQTLDTNSQWLSAKLAAMGVSTLYHQTVADDQAMIARALTTAAELTSLVLVTGGLGPTDDDLTRQAMAEAMGVELVADAASLQAIRERMERAGRTMPERNAIQAMHPAGTRMIPNTCGTAPGIHATLGQAMIFVMPGPPSEMTTMWERDVAPALVHAGVGGNQVILTAKVNTFGVGESTVAEMLGELCDRKRNPLVGTTVSQSIVAVRIRSEFDDAGTARDQLDATLAAVENRLGPAIFGFEGQTLQEAVISELAESRQTIVTAESCTGGLIGRMLTDVAGSSAVFRGGWVTYSNVMKTSQLGVPYEAIEQDGAVSEAVARTMATGALERSDADLSIAVTGVAGPDGGTADKPVGTVWIALGLGDGESVARQFRFGGDREMIRDRAAKMAIQMLRLHLRDAPFDDMLFAVRPVTPA